MGNKENKQIIISQQNDTIIKLHETTYNNRNWKQDTWVMLQLHYDITEYRIEPKLDLPLTKVKFKILIFDIYF